MKKSILIVSASLLLVLSIGVFIYADPPEGPNVSQYCTASGNFGFTHSMCVSVLTKCNNKCEEPPGNNLYLCKNFKANNPEKFAETFGNISQCVSILNYPPE